MIKKVDDGWATATSDGKLIHKFKTKKEALAQLRAIEASKAKKKQKVR